MKLRMAIQFIVEQNTLKYYRAMRRGLIIKFKVLKRLRIKCFMSVNLGSSLVLFEVLPHFIFVFRDKKVKNDRVQILSS